MEKNQQRGWAPVVLGSGGGREDLGNEAWAILLLLLETSSYDRYKLTESSTMGKFPPQNFLENRQLELKLESWLRTFLFLPISGIKGLHDTIRNWENHSGQESLFLIQMKIFSQHLCFPSYIYWGHFMECSPDKLLSRVSLADREGQIHSHMGLVFLEPLSLSNGNPGSSFPTCNCPRKPKPFFQISSSLHGLLCSHVLPGLLGCCKREGDFSVTV